MWFVALSTILTFDLVLLMVSRMVTLGMKLLKRYLLNLLRLLVNSVTLILLNIPHVSAVSNCLILSLKIVVVFGRMVVIMCCVSRIMFIIRLIS